MLVCGRTHMWRAALSILLIAYVPGALTLRLPVGRRALRAALPAEERLFWSVAISVTTPLSTCNLTFRRISLGVRVGTTALTI